MRWTFEAKCSVTRVEAIRRRREDQEKDGLGRAHRLFGDLLSFLCRRRGDDVAAADGTVYSQWLGPFWIRVRHERTGETITTELSS